MIPEDLAIAQALTSGRPVPPILVSVPYTDSSLAPKPRREVWAVLRLRIPEDMTDEDAARELAASVEFGQPVIDVIPARPGERRPFCPVCLDWPHRIWCKGPRSGPPGSATLVSKPSGSRTLSGSRPEALNGRERPAPLAPGRPRAGLSGPERL